MNEIVDSIISKETNLKSVSLEGYSYFLPQGVNLNTSDKENSILYYNRKKMYLYVDLISYYHKVESTYTTNPNAYYSLAIDKNGKKGYLEITQIGENYFIEYMYYYSKIEAFVQREDLKKTVTVMSYILNSIKMNDEIIESFIGSNSYHSKEEQFNIFKPNGQESDFLDIIEQYDDGRTQSKNEDILDIDENIE